MLNILGISRFIVLFSATSGEDGWTWNWGRWGQYNFALAVGVLPYPITFLCTDLISEFWGRRRANWVVTVGLMLNAWVVLILWLGGIMPQQPELHDGVPSVRIEKRDAQAGPTPQFDTPETELQRINRHYVARIPDGYSFYQIRHFAFGAVVASMIAYMAAQFCDVYVFHFWKDLTRGKHLWLRNNGSTLVSQMIDTVAVILITQFYAKALPPPAEGISLTEHLANFIATGYVFKMVAALLDTIPFYLCVSYLKRHLEYDPQSEHL